MKRNLFTLGFTIASMLTYGQSIKDLDFLIGTWDIVETIYPGTDKEYRELGVRTCSYYLDDSFIKCESTTIDQRNQRKRTYAYHINYDKKNNVFRATNFANDFPLHGQFEWYLDKDSKEIKAITPINVVPDRFFRATIDYSNPDKLVWNGWRSVFKKDKEWVQVFNDVTTKKK